ncbi:MAG: Fe-S-binding domain-containing protein, partial [Bdellovibrio sp.]
MLLSILVFCPLLFALILAMVGSARWIRPTALVFSLVEFVLSLVMLAQFDASTPALQMVERYPWITRFGVTYFLGLDGLSLWLVLLTTFLMPIVVVASWKSIEDRVKAFHCSLFVLQTAMIGTFLALDAVFFYFFWELSLVPMYLIIGIWGGPRRIYATVKFFIYTMIGSVLMLLAMIYLLHQTGEQLGTVSASLLDFYKLHIPFVVGRFLTPQSLLFWAFVLAFAIKIPMFPFHTWLPDAHVEAPTPGSVILAAVMLKMGTYGFLRWVLPMFPDAVAAYSWFFFFVGSVGIIYGALVAMVQPDIKKLVAYSSVSHMGYVIVGLFALNELGVTGGLFQMLNHGVSTGALFLLVGMIYERTHSREISKYGGLASVLPLFSIFFFLITLSSIAVPLTNGFVGEFLILLGTFKSNVWAGAASVFGVILGAAYMLWMFKRVFFGKEGELVSDKAHPLKDLNWREIAVMVPLVILVFWMGIFPGHFLNMSRASISHLIENKENYQLAIQGE